MIFTCKKPFSDILNYIMNLHAESKKTKCGGKNICPNNINITKFVVMKKFWMTILRIYSRVIEDRWRKLIN